MIQEEFLGSVKRYTFDSSQGQTMWREIEDQYSKSGRHYHTLTHLDSMLTELKPYQGQLKDWDMIVFSIAYHDVIYSSLKNNNEMRSAEVAEARLASISVPEKVITQCRKLILATKTHEVSDLVTNLFTDADLSILGAEPDRYQQYAKDVRAEYGIYPDMIYNPGRKKVLMHFLTMDNIYKTRDFSERYEHRAKMNISAELQSLQKSSLL